MPREGQTVDIPIQQLSGSGLGSINLHKVKRQGEDPAQEQKKGRPPLKMENLGGAILCGRFLRYTWLKKAKQSPTLTLC